MIRRFCPILSVVFFSLFLVRPAIAQIDPVGEILLPSDGSQWYMWTAEKDGYAYALTDSHTLAIFDVRSLSVDGPFKTFNTPLSTRKVEGGRGILRNGNVLYLFGDGITVFDITNPANPVKGVSTADYGFRSLYLDGDYLIGTGNDNVTVYSITSPASPSQIISAGLDGRTGHSVARYMSDCIYVGEYGSGEYFGLRVFRWNMGQGTLTSVYQKQTDDLPFHLFVQGSFLACTDSNQITLWSLADAYRPAIFWRQQASGRAAMVWANKIITNGSVFHWDPTGLASFCNFAPGGSQTSGLPYGMTGNSKFIFLSQSKRILILTAPPTLVFPQFATGAVGSTLNRTRMILSNTGTRTATGSIRFQDKTGAGSQVPVGGQKKAEWTFSIPAGGTTQIVTDGNGALASGTLVLRSDQQGDSAIGGTEIFDLLGYSASVQPAQLARFHRAFISRTAAENSGVAMYNPSLTTTVQVRAFLFDKNGVQQSQPKTISLPPRTQLAVFLDEPALFQSYFTPGIQFEGSLSLNVDSGGPIAVVALIQKASNGSLLVVPVQSTIPLED